VLVETVTTRMVSPEIEGLPQGGAEILRTGYALGIKVASPAGNVSLHKSRFVAEKSVTETGQR